MEKNGNCPQKVEGYENVSDFSDMSQGFYTVVLQYQAARRSREQSERNIPALNILKQATIHEDQAPIVARGEGDKEKEKKTVTETVLNKDCSKETEGAKEEDEERLEERESMQRWLIDNC